MDFLEGIEEITLEFTQSCNLNCKYCGQKDYKENKHDMKLETIEKCIDIICNSKKSNKNLILFGGEASIKQNEIEHCINYLIKKYHHIAKDVNFRIQTNGVVMNDNYLNILKKINLYSNINFSFSLDGYKELHDKNRIDKNGKGTWDIIIDNMKIIKREIPNSKINIHTVVTDDVLFNIDKVVNELNGIKELFDTISVGMLATPLNKNNVNYIDNFYYSIDAFKHFFNFYFENREKESILEKISSYLIPDKEHLDEHPRCNAGSTEISVSYDGYIYPCIKFYYCNNNDKFMNLINVNDKDFNNKIETSIYKWKEIIELNKDKRNIHFKSENGYDCKKCPMDPFCNHCLSENLILNNDYKIRPRYMCDNNLIRLKSYLEVAEKFFKKKEETLINKQYKDLTDILKILKETGKLSVNINKKID